jgi:hypothetical protein
MESGSILALSQGWTLASVKVGTRRRDGSSSYVTAPVNHGFQSRTPRMPGDLARLERYFSVRAAAIDSTDFLQSNSCLAKQQRNFKGMGSPKSIMKREIAAIGPPRK